MTWIRLGFRNIMKNRRRSIITLMAMAVGYTAVSLFQGYVTDMRAGLRRGAIHGEALGHLILFKKGALTAGKLDEEKYILTGEELEKICTLLRPIPSVKLFIPRLELSGLVSNGKESMIFIGQGIDPDVYRQLKQGFSFTGEGTRITRESPIGGQVASDLAQTLGLKLGKTTVLFSITLAGHMNAVDMDIQGIYNTGTRATNDKYVLVPLDLARKLYDTDGASQLSILLNSLNDIPETKTLMEQILREANLDMEIKPWNEMSAFYTNVSNLFGMIFLFLFIIILVVVVMGVLNTMSMSIMERFREIGTLRAFGLKRSGVLKLFCSEALVLGSIGALLGIVLTLILVCLINAAQIRYTPPGSSESVLLEVVLQLKPLVANALVMIAFCVLAAIFPSRAAARMRIVSALVHV